MTSPPPLQYLFFLIHSPARRPLVLSYSIHASTISLSRLPPPPPRVPNVLFVTFLNKNRPCWVMAPKLYIYLFFCSLPLSLSVLPYPLPTSWSALPARCPFHSFSLTMDRWGVLVGGGDGDAGKCLYNLYVLHSRPEGFYHITGSLAPGVNNVEKWIQHFWTVFMGSCFSLLLFSFFIHTYVYIYTHTHT